MSRFGWSDADLEIVASSEASPLAEITPCLTRQTALFVSGSGLIKAKVLLRVTESLLRA